MEEDENQKIRLDLVIAQQQAEDYKQSFQGLQKEYSSLKTENESLRAQLQSMQSIKGIDARQADALRKTLQQYQQENESLKRQLEQLGQQQNSNQLQQQSMFMNGNTQLQQQVNQLQQEKMMFQQNYEMVQSQLDEKKRAYNLLKVRVDARDFIASIPVGNEANKLMVLGKENQRINEQLVMRDREIEDLKRNQLDQQNLQAQNDQLATQLRKYQETVITLSGEVERLLTEVGGLRFDVFMKQDLDRKKKELADLQQEHSQLAEKYSKLQSESSDVNRLNRELQELERRHSQAIERSEQLEVENRGITMKLHNYDRMLKEKENAEKRVQELDNNITELQNQLKDKQREYASIKRDFDDREGDLQKFKDTIHQPAMERYRRLEYELENWRNKCLALENNFFGNSERQYINNELTRLNGRITELQSENDELKANLRRAARVSAPSAPSGDSANEERVKLLYAERERLFGEIEQLRRKNTQLEGDLSRSAQRSPQPQQIQIIQQDPQVFLQRTQVPAQEILRQQQMEGELFKQVQEKDKQLEDLNQGIELLIDENKALKQEIDTLQFQMQQLEIEKSYAQQRQWLNQKENNQFELLARLSSGDGDPKVRAWEQLARRLYEDLREKNRPYENQAQDQQFFSVLQQKDREIEQLRNKFSEFQRIGDSSQIQVTELKRLRDVLERQSYEIEEWKLKYRQSQDQQRVQEQFGNGGVLEVENRQLKQLLETRTREIEMLKQRLIEAQQMPGSNNKEAAESELRKLRVVLQMRTAENEELRVKCQRLSDQPQPFLQGKNNSPELARLQQMYEQKNNECEDIKMKYSQLAKTKDKSAAGVIDELQNEVKKHQRGHEQKANELSEVHYKSQNLLKERDLLEKELRRVKGILEEQISENEQLKRRLQQTPISPATNYNNNAELDRQFRELQQKYNQLQSEVGNKHAENDRLKQNHASQQQQMKSVAMDAKDKDQRMKDLGQDNDRMKGLLEQKQRETDDLKAQLQKVSITVNNLGNQLQDAKRNQPPVEQVKAQNQFLQLQSKEKDGRMQQLQNELQKCANILKDKQIENEKLKNQMNQIEIMKRDKETMNQQFQQQKQQYDQKCMENEKMRQALQQAQKKIQELQETEAQMKRAQEQLQSVLGNIGGKR